MFFSSFCLLLSSRYSSSRYPSSCYSFFTFFFLRFLLSSLSSFFAFFFLRSLFSSPLLSVLSVSSVLKAFFNFNPSHSIPSLTSSALQTLHSKRSAARARAAPRFHLVSPTPPTPAVRIVPPASLHTPARSVTHQFRPVAAVPETIPPQGRAPPSSSHAARPAIARFARHSRRPRHRARSPTAAPPKTNALPPQIPGTLRAASISGCVSIRIPASPNLKSRNEIGRA